ncbi:hypothetical protein ACFV46_29030 [Streptomyces sp. NPDC059852]
MHHTGGGDERPGSPAHERVMEGAGPAGVYAVVDDVDAPPPAGTGG